MEANYNNTMNPQDGTNTSIYGLCITAFLTILSKMSLVIAPFMTIIGEVKLTDVLTVCAIIAAISTTAVNAKNYFKKTK